MTAHVVLAFWFGGPVGLFGMIIATWNRPASTQADKDAFAAFASEHPAILFGLVVLFVVCWPALVLYLLAEKDEKTDG